MAGKRYQAKDRKVAKMERTGLVEENVRTGEKSRTSKESTREITFEGRSDSGKREDLSVQNTFASSSRSSNRNTGSRRFHRSRDIREREADGSGNQEPFKSYSNTPYPEKEDTRESPYLGDQKENGSRQEEYTNIRNNRTGNAEPGDPFNNRGHSETSDSKERTRNRRKSAEKYREQDSASRERPDGSPDKSGAGINSTSPDDHLPGISSEDLHRKIRKDQVRQGFQKAQAAQGQGLSSFGEDIRPGTGSYSYSSGNSAPGVENSTEALSASIQKSKLMFGDESSGMVRGAGMAMAGHAAGKLAYGAGRYAYRRLREDTEQEAEAIGDSTANDAIHQAERAGEGAVRMASARSPNGSKSVRKGMNEKQRLITAASRRKDLVSDDPADVGKRIAREKKKSTAEINRFWQRKRYKDAYKKASNEADAFMTEIRALVSKILMDCRNVSDADRLCLKHFEEVGTCPICGNPVLIGSKSYFCSNQDCRFVIWKDLAFLHSMKKQVDDDMAAQLLTNGEVKVDKLYSAKKDKYFSAKLVMEIIDDKPEYSLEFPKRDKKGKKKKSKWE